MHHYLNSYLVLFPTKGIDKLKFVICNKNNKIAKKKRGGGGGGGGGGILENLRTIYTNKLGRDELAGPHCTCEGESVHPQS
jgi:hypothetical protein